MSTIADYAGRTIDVLAFQGVVAKGHVRLVQALALEGESGRVTTGANKLAQRFLIELLTERGSMPFWPARGTTFLLEVSRGQVRTVTQLFAAISRGLLDARRNLTSEETDSDPDDERYGSAEVLSVEISDGTAKVFLRLQSRAADAKLILPIEISI